MVKKFDKIYLLVALLAVVIFVPFFSGLYVEGDDTYYHLANIESLASGSWLDLFTTKIFSGIGNNLGYGVGLFYPQLSHIVAAVFVKLGWGVIAGAKMSHILAMIFSGLIMYKLMKVATKGNRLAALVAAVLYMWAPYHIIDDYVRDAMAEVWAFPFLPMVFLSLIYFWQKKYRWFYLCFIVGFAGMANSHLVLTMYAAIFMIICLLLRGKEFWRWEVIRKFILAAVGVLLLILPLAVSIVSMKFSGVEYVAYTEEMSSPSWAENDALWPWQMLIFIPGNRDFYPFTINIIGLGLVIYACVKLRKKTLKLNKETGWILKCGLAIMIGGAWLASKLWPWIIMPGFLCTIQFPWRLVMFVNFGMCVVCGIMLTQLKREKVQRWVASLLLVSAAVYAGVIIVNNVNFKEIDMSSEATRVSLNEVGMGWQREYLPVAAKENSEYFDNRSATEIVELRDGWVELPRIYYPGYEITVNGDAVDYEMSENGFIKVQAEVKDEIKYEYVGTFIMRVAERLKILGIVFLIILLCR